MPNYRNSTYLNLRIEYSYDGHNLSVIFPYEMRVTKSGQLKPGHVKSAKVNERGTITLLLDVKANQEGIDAIMQGGEGTINLSMPPGQLPTEECNYDVTIRNGRLQSADLLDAVRKASKWEALTGKTYMQSMSENRSLRGHTIGAQIGKSCTNLPPNKFSKSKGCWSYSDPDTQ